MAAVGFASLPITISARGIVAEWDKTLSGPMQKAAQNAATKMEATVVKGASSAADAVSKAEYRQKKATEELTVAESKLAEQKLKSEAANKAVEAAARAREAAEAKGVAAVEKAEEALLKKRAAAEREARNLVKAESGVEKALSESARAAKSLEERQAALSDAYDEGEKSSRGFRDRLRELADESDSAGGAFDGLAGKVGGLVGALAGVASVGAFAGLGKELASETSLINLQLGYTGDAAEGVGESIKEALKSGVAGSAEEAANAIGALESQFKYLGSEGEQTAGELADNFIALSKVMGVDVAEATQTAGQLIRNGLATDVEEAADLMATAMQRAPVAMREEIPELINEYGTFFNSLGFDGKEAFGVLVNASDQGKIAMDKIGDAMKEVGIRATDIGDKGAVEALEAIGLGGEDIQNRLLAGGAAAQEAFSQITEAILSVEDPAEQAEAAVALIGTPLEDLNKVELEGFLSSFANAGAAMEGFEGATQGMADTIADTLEGRLNALKGTVQSVAGDAFMGLWDVMEADIIPAMQEFGDWVQRNQSWLAPLGVAVGVLAGSIALAAAAIGTWNGAMALYKTVTAIATGQTLLFNNALKTNVIILVVSAIAALVAGLVYFFTQTETGKRVWESFTGAIVAGWDWVVEKLSAGWDWIYSNVLNPIGSAFTALWNDYLSPVVTFIADAWWKLATTMFTVYSTVIKATWDALVTAAKVVAAVVLTALITPIMIAWNLLSDTIKSVWENQIRPVWEAIAAAAEHLWNTVLVPAFEGITAGFQAVGDGFKWVWESLIKPAWDAMAAAAEWLWNTVLVPAFEGIKAGFTAVGDALNWVWENVIKVAIEAWAAIFNWLWNSVISPTIDWIVGKWESMGNALNATWIWVKDNVFGGLEKGLGVVKNAFQTAVDGITSIWDKVRAAAAKPIKFVIESVFNNGIVEAWNKVADWVNLPTISKYEPDWLGAYADGGVLPGYSPGKDDYLFRDVKTGKALALGGGEAILRPEVTRGMGGEPAINALNRAAKNGGVNGVKKVLGQGAQFADGGIIDRKIFSTMQQLRQEHGKPYQWGGIGDPSWDCSGLWSGARYGLDGKDIRGPRQFNTVSLIANPGAFGFIPGLSGRVTVGVSNDHMSGTIDGVNIESASMPKGVQIGGSAWGSDNSYYPHKFTLAELGGDFMSGGNGGGGGVSMRSMLAGLINGVMTPIGNAIPEGGGLIGGLPRAAFDKFKETIVNFIGGKADTVGGTSNITVGEGVERYRGLVEKVLLAKGFDKSMTNTVLRRMDQESSGDPRSINNWDSNAAQGWPTKGLMQMRDDTFASHADPGFNNIWGEEDNIRSSMNYAISRYGSLSAAYDKSGGYHNGGLAPAGQGLLKKTAMEPEMVLNPAMTQAFIDWMQVPGGKSNDISRLVFTLQQIAPKLGELANNQGAMLEMRYALAGQDAGQGELNRVLGPELADRLLGFIAGPMDAVNAGLQSASDAAMNLGNSLAGPLVDSTEEVQKAFAELDAARKKASKGSEKIAAAEKALADAQKELEEAMNSTVDASTSNARKIEDAEEALAEARAAQAEVANKEHKDAEARSKASASAAEKVADAEKKLARAREDVSSQTEKDETKRAESIEKAKEKVAKAEQGIEDARLETIQASEDVALAERKVAAARITAVTRMSTDIVSGFQSMAEGASSFMAVMASFAAQVEETEERLRGLRVESATAELNRLKALVNLTQAEKDLETARTGGAETTRKIGDTSVAALGRALTKFRETGVLSVEMITESVNSGIGSTTATASDAQETMRQAVIAQQLAALDYLKASLDQQKITELQKILTAQLAAQQTALFGIGQAQYSALSMFIKGIATILSGIVKIGMAIGSAIAAIATGGMMAIPAAIAGIGLAISGIGDIMTGGIMVKDNWEGAKDAWGKMDLDGKIMLVGTALGSAGQQVSNIASGQNGPDDAWANLEKYMTVKWEASNAKYDDMIELLEKSYQSQMEQIEIFRQALELAASTNDQDILDQIDIPALLDTVRGASAKPEALELVDAERAAALRRDEIAAQVTVIAERTKTVQPVVLNVTGDAITIETMNEIVAEINAQAARLGTVEVRLNQVGKADAQQKLAAAR